MRASCRTAPPSFTYSKFYGLVHQLGGMCLGALLFQKENCMSYPNGLAGTPVLLNCIHQHTVSALGSVIFMSARTQLVLSLLVRHVHHVPVAAADMR
jgi:hypothetical protein